MDPGIAIERLCWLRDNYLVLSAGVTVIADAKTPCRLG